jgi:phosphohistidine phosphatase SixA
MTLSGGLCMRLYLVQHGEAKPEAEDPERPLTSRGTEDVKRVAGTLRKLQIKQPKIVHSGKLRAKQTAEILGQGLNISLSLVQGSPVLNPNDPVRPWAERIQKELPSSRNWHRCSCAATKMQSWSCFDTERSSVWSKKRTRDGPSGGF